MTGIYELFLLTLEIIKKVSEGGDFNYHYEPKNLSITLNGKTYQQGDYTHPIDMRNEMMDIERDSVKSEEVAISKTETTSCEDDTYSQCEECGQFYLDRRGYDYCPNCGRRLEATI